MSKTRGDTIASAIKELMRYYRLGIKLRLKPGRAKSPGAGRHPAQARQRSRLEYAHKALQFTDPKMGYTDSELTELLSLIRRRSPGAEGKPRVIGRFHVWRLLRVPKPHRPELQTEAIRGGWSLRRLEVEIARRFGSGAQGGRRRRLPDDRAGRLAVLERECESWRRLGAALDRVWAGGRQGESVGTILRQMKVATAAVAKLHRALDAALRKEDDRYSGRATSPRRPTTGRDLTRRR
jgi:hypothetical protein